MDYILETNHLIKKHGTTYRVKDVNLHVPEHSVYGFFRSKRRGGKPPLSNLSSV